MAETALRESEERYRRFFEEDLTGDYTAAPSGQLLTCNPAFASIFGFPAVTEALQGNLAALITDCGVPPAAETLRIPNPTAPK